MEVFVIVIYSESGDCYEPLILDCNPSNEFLERFLREKFPDEFPHDLSEDERGPGVFGSYLHLKHYKTNLISIKNV